MNTIAMALVHREDDVAGHMFLLILQHGEVFIKNWKH